ncbi:flagellar basal body rod protein FlgB [Desulfofundulus sp. TPOSR]|uniref:flagellar basal body rod protein FlgB n=1 Tax=Desulfofundulus sp. TPOSR TaxID=2714340 RepID=UPI00140B49C0|nr:flagellar basal body rod protein FlgB [Desulfofundulus sp. TPOSR]NHM28202.1 flagellar basal body rod protein FlgB [Desulfofundulus sp. TPOSR]
MDLFASPILVALQKQLDAAALTQRVIAHNVANVNTPGFKKSSVSFTEELRRALGEDVLPLVTSDPRHIGAPVPLARVEPTVVKEEGTTMGYNGNNVDIDQEMVNLAANTLTYQAAARALGDRLSLLTYVIRGR